MDEEGTNDTQCKDQALPNQLVMVPAAAAEAAAAAVGQARSRLRARCINTAHLTACFEAHPTSLCAHHDTAASRRSAEVLSEANPNAASCWV